MNWKWNEHFGITQNSQLMIIGNSGDTTSEDWRSHCLGQSIAAGPSPPPPAPIIFSPKWLADFYFMTAS